VIDLRSNRDAPDTLTSFDAHCVVGRSVGMTDIGRTLDGARLHALCFEYDHPTIASLTLLKKTKQAYPAIPILMVTHQHSEALEAWARRSGVWDYFVSPVSADDLRRCLDALSALPLAGAGDTQRDIIRSSSASPNEARFHACDDAGGSDRLEQAADYIERNLSQKISQNKLAKHCGLAVLQFSRLFKQRFGVTFQTYVQERRIMEAVQLLKHPDASVTDVCFTVGFFDPAYFTRVFRRYVGYTPSDYKRLFCGTSIAPENRSELTTAE